MCTKCEENAEKSPVIDTPIFWSVVNDMRAVGHELRWYQIVKPSGTIGILGDISYGIHPTYGAMIRNPSGLDLS